MSKTMDQRRAHWSWKSTEQIRNSNTDFAKYLSVINSMPAMIQACGLAQTAAFLVSKGNDEHLNAMMSLGKWVQDGFLNHNTNWSTHNPSNQREFLTRIMTKQREDYQMIAEESLVYLNWLKRWANALKNDPEVRNGA